MKYAVVAAALFVAGCQSTYTMHLKMHEHSDPEGYQMLQECLGNGVGDTDTNVEPLVGRELTRYEALAFQRLTFKIEDGEPLSAADFAEMACVNTP